MGKSDLHIHSSASDGEFEPSSVVELAARRGLDCISLTDHDTVEGYYEALETGNRLDVKILPGIELTAIYKKRETHILAYAFDPESEALKNLLKHQKNVRLKRAEDIIKTLNGWGFEIDIDEVKAEARSINIARPHIANVLIRKGYVASYREAFMRYLGDQILQHINADYADFKEVIRVIRDSGGATSLAHPGLNFAEKDIEKFIEAGLDGIEYIHPSHNYELQTKYEELARKYELLLTGGSDFHGSSNDHMQNLGVIAISNSRVEKLEQLCDQRQKLTSTEIE